MARGQEAHPALEQHPLSPAPPVDDFKAAPRSHVFQARPEALGQLGALQVAGKPPAEQHVLERVTNFFKGFGLGAVEVVQSLGQLAQNLNDVTPILMASGALADFIVSPLTGKSPGQIVNERGQRAQAAGRELLHQTASMMKLALDLSTPALQANFFNMSKSLAQDLVGLKNRGQLTPARVMEAVRQRTGQNPSIQAAQTLIDSVTNYKAIVQSGGDPEQIGKGAFRLFAALAPFAKAKVAGRPPSAGLTAPPRPQGVTPIVAQPAPTAASDYFGTLARVPNNPVGRAYVQAYNLADDLIRAQGGQVQGIGGSIAEGRGRLAIFDRKVWSTDAARRLDKMPISPDVPLPPEMEALARQLPPGSIEAKLAGGKGIPSDLDILVDGLGFAQQKAIKDAVFNRTGVLVEFMKPGSGKGRATGLSH